MISPSSFMWMLNSKGERNDLRASTYERPLTQSLLPHYHRMELFTEEEKQPLQTTIPNICRQSNKISWLMVLKTAAGCNKSGGIDYPHPSPDNALLRVAKVASILHLELITWMKKFRRSPSSRELRTCSTTISSITPPKKVSSIVPYYY